jgi:hypothetical protein
MDLRVFYQKIRSIEKEIVPMFVVVVSLDTPEGGKAGALTEVRRDVAAKLIVEGRARLANTEESDEFRKQNRRPVRRVEQ